MLPEKIYYPHDFPLTITIARIERSASPLPSGRGTCRRFTGKYHSEKRQLHLHSAKGEHLRQ